MNQILLSDNPWMSKDGQLLVGGRPLSVISINQADAKQLKNLMEFGLLEVDENNQELADLLLEKNICRPVHNFTSGEIESVSGEIMILFKVVPDLEACVSCLELLTTGPSPFEKSQFFIYSESQELIDSLINRFGGGDQFNLISSESKTIRSIASYKYFIAMEKPLEVASIELKALLLELQSEQSDLIIPRIIGSSANLTSSHSSTMISHFEEHSSLYQIGSEWSKMPADSLGDYQGIPLLLGKNEILGQTGITASRNSTALTDEIMATASSNTATLVYEPDILVRELEHRDLGKFIISSFQKGSSISRARRVHPSSADVRLINFLNLSAPLLAGRIGLMISTLFSSLQIAYASQKLTPQPHGDLAAINFFLRSHRISMDELYQTFRQPIALPITLLSPFSKTARKTALGFLIFKAYKISRQADKAEIPTHVLLSCLRDIAISAGIWTAALNLGNPAIALPKINSMKWKVASKYPSLKKERQLQTN